MFFSIMLFFVFCLFCQVLVGLTCVCQLLSLFCRMCVAACSYITFLLQVRAFTNHFVGGPCAQKKHVMEVGALTNHCFGGPWRSVRSKISFLEVRALARSKITFCWRSTHSTFFLLNFARSQITFAEVRARSKITFFVGGPHLQNL